MIDAFTRSAARLSFLLAISLQLLSPSSASAAAGESCSLLFVLSPSQTGVQSSVPKWVSEYKSPKPLASDIIAAVEKIPEFADRKTRIMVPIGAGASSAGVDALISRARFMEQGVELHMWVNGIPKPIMDKVRTSEGKVKIVAHFLGPNMRELYNDGFVQLVPGYLGQFAARVSENHPDYKFDAILTRVSKPDEKGAVSFGANCDSICTVLKIQPDVMVIAEVNDKIPYTHARRGMNTISKKRVAASFKSDAKLAYPEVVALTPVEEAIGMNLASLIESKSQLQVGIGNIFGGLPAGLRHYGRKEIQIWTEMMGDVLKEVMDDGIATDATIGFGFGSQSFYDWLDRNPRVRLAATSLVNDPKTVAKMKSFHAVNTALQVSFTGEVNATAGPPERGRISSPGGQVEFLMGASWSQGGKAIIAIRSTATVSTPNGPAMVSTIVPRTYPVRDGTPNAFVSHIVTEYGVAELRGKSEREKTIALIRIAHPKFRAELFDQAIDPKNPDRIPGLTEADRAAVLR